MWFAELIPQRLDDDQADCYHTASALARFSNPLSLTFGRIAGVPPALSAEREKQIDEFRATARWRDAGKMPRSFMSTNQTKIFIADEVSDSGLEPLRAAGFAVEK